MLTRLLIALDGSPGADVALEQGIVLGRRFRSTLVLAGVRGADGPVPDPATLERARLRVEAAGLPVEVASTEGQLDLVLRTLAGDVDAVLVSRRAASPAGDALGSAAAAAVRAAPVCMIACGSAASPMREVALAFDGSEPSRRALEMAAQFGSVVGGTVHVIHTNDDHEAGLRIVGAAEATLSLHDVDFETHVEPDSSGEAVARVIRETGCDVIFVGAQLAPRTPGRPSPVVVSHAEQILRHTAVPVVIQP